MILILKSKSFPVFRALNWKREWRINFYVLVFCVRCIHTSNFLHLTRWAIQWTSQIDRNDCSNEICRGERSTHKDTGTRNMKDEIWAPASFRWSLYRLFSGIGKNRKSPIALFIWSVYTRSVNVALEMGKTDRLISFLLPTCPHNRIQDTSLLYRRRLYPIKQGEETVVGVPKSYISIT